MDSPSRHRACSESQLFLMPHRLKHFLACPLTWINGRSLQRLRAAICAVRQGGRAGALIKNSALRATAMREAGCSAHPGSDDSIGKARRALDADRDTACQQQREEAHADASGTHAKPPLLTAFARILRQHCNVRNSPPGAGPPGGPGRPFRARGHRGGRRPGCAPRVRVLRCRESGAVRRVAWRVPLRVTYKSGGEGSGERACRYRSVAALAPAVRC